MKPETISVHYYHLIEANPSVPPRPALDYSVLGVTQPNLHYVSTQFPRALGLKFKDPPCLLEAPSAVSPAPIWDGESKLLFACGR